MVDGNVRYREGQLNGWMTGFGSDSATLPSAQADTRASCDVERGLPKRTCLSKAEAAGGSFERELTFDEEC